MPSKQRASRLILPSLALLVLSSVLMLGSVHTASSLIAGLFSAGLGLLLAFSGSGRLPFPAWLWLALAGYTALQALPLPLGWLEALAPQNADVWRRALHPLAEPAPRWAPVSLAPGQSLLGAVHAFSYGVAVLAGYRVARRSGAEACLVLGLGAASLAALITLAHGLLGVREVYGVYQPSFTVSRWAVGPLLNSNNLAGYLNLGVFSGVGLLLSSQSRLPKWLVRVALVLCAAGTLTTGSSGGIGALFIGLVVAGLWYWRGARQGYAATSRASTFGLALVGLTLGGLVMGWAALRSVMSPELGKLKLLEAAGGLVSDHRWFGVGRGGFGSAFHAYVSLPRDVSTEYAENFPVQWLSEWGLVGASMALIGLLYVVWRLLPSYRRGFGVRTAVLGAVTALVLQNLVDLSFEVPAVSVLCFTLVGAAWPSRTRRTRRAAVTESGTDASVVSTSVELTDRASLSDADSGAGRAPEPAPEGTLDGSSEAAASAPGSSVIQTKWSAVSPRTSPSRSRSGERAALWHLRLVVLAGAALWALTAFVRPTSLIQERREVHQAYETGGDVNARLRQAMLRFPAEPYFSRVGALVALRSGGDPMPWLQRALERGMNNGRTHLLVADVLIAKKHTHQALLELSLAMELHDDLVGAGSRRALQLSRDPELLRRAVPKGRNRDRVLLALGTGLSGEARERFVREALELNPELTPARAALAVELLSAWSLGAEGRCAGRLGACRDELLQHITELQQVESQRATAHLLRAQLALAEDELPRATQEMAACRQLPEPSGCLRFAVQVAFRAEPTRAREVAEEVLAQGCRSRPECGALASELAALFTGPGQQEARWRLLRRAAEELDTLESWLQAARAAEAAGRASDAYRIVNRMHGLHPDDATVASELQRLTGALKPKP